MIAAYKNNTYGKRIPVATRRDIALQAFKNQQTVSDISKDMDAAEQQFISNKTKH